MAYFPEQGDIVWISFDPSSGKEIMKRRPAYVISRKIFNEHTGLAIIAPISSTVRGIKLEVVLPEQLKPTFRAFAEMISELQKSYFSQNSILAITYQVANSHHLSRSFV